MDIEKRCQKARKMLDEIGQGHLLRFWGDLGEDQKQQLLEQIEALEPAQVREWVRTYVKGEGVPTVPANLRPASAYPAEPVTVELRKKYEKAREKGRQLISGGKVAALVVAGGQGTRLGYDGPKGDFPITPVKGKTFFRLFAEQIAATAKRYRASLPWYVMTSPLNRKATEEIFERNEWFGLDRNDVFLFEQGTLPNFDFEGRILMDSKSSLSQSPNGHGGTVRALGDSGALADMTARGIEQISYFQVDNPLVQIFDPLFIGLHAIEGAEMSSKALAKADPEEKIGAFCEVDGKIAVIEYSDLTNEQAHMRTADGKLLFGLGSIAIHIISAKFIERLCHGRTRLPLHRAIKKIPCIDSSGRRIQPDEVNGIKLEMFIFDAIRMARKSLILETLRSEEFAPVKNAAGADSPEVARKMMTERAAAWLEAAGMRIPRRTDGSVDAVIEMSPAFALDPGQVKAKIHKVKRIKAGDKVYLE